MHIKANATEVNLDCLVGPTHNFAGLSNGNLASIKNKMRASNPKAAALQGLKKMRFLAEKGFVQIVLPPHPRPYLPILRNLGFSGSDEKILERSFKNCPEIFFASISSSAMWTANSATVSPSTDSKDNKVHITPANLLSMFHRTLEAVYSTKIFREIFTDFIIHEALPSHSLFADEGAANHSRLAPNHADSGMQIFVYGESVFSNSFPRRQSRRAQDAISRLHKLDPQKTFFIEQNPLAIDQGAFHNDVVALAHENIFLCHSEAYKDQTNITTQLKRRYLELYGEELKIIEIKNELLPLEDAVKSYLFNSQLLTKKTGRMLLLTPLDCHKYPNAIKAISEIRQRCPNIDEVHFIDLSESMANGGGPACLRLRLVLTEMELLKIKSSVILSISLAEKLEKVVQKYYVEHFIPQMLFDKSFLLKINEAFQEIYSILGIFYDG